MMQRAILIVACFAFACAVHYKTPLRNFVAPLRRTQPQCDVLQKCGSTSSFRRNFSAEFRLPWSADQISIEILGCPRFDVDVDFQNHLTARSEEIENQLRMFPQSVPTRQLWRIWVKPPAN